MIGDLHTFRHLFIFRHDIIEPAKLVDCVQISRNAVLRKFHARFYCKRVHNSVMVAVLVTIDSNLGYSLTYISIYFFC
ncbi:hypothetical protein SDC9_90511 [bioreactor metagenome]|uniref:Uncharacterized protein n=1 Tax=bioreactor metagenome TaxID=1076179 RepID=A0A645A206_9ZZZZ